MAGRRCLNEPNSGGKLGPREVNPPAACILPNIFDLLHSRLPVAWYPRPPMRNSSSWTPAPSKKVRKELSAAPAGSLSPRSQPFRESLLISWLGWQTSARKRLCRNQEDLDPYRKEAKDSRSGVLEASQLSMHGETGRGLPLSRGDRK